MEIKELLQQAEERMNKSIEALKHEFASIRTGRASVALLDKVMVDYYGSPSPINQVANISVPEPRMIVIAPWDKTMIGAIEKAILQSDLGLNPGNDGAQIRLSIPQLTEERRKEIVKVVHKKAEDAKVAVRNIRAESNIAPSNIGMVTTVPADWHPAEPGPVARSAAVTQSAAQSVTESASSSAAVWRRRSSP